MPLETAIGRRAWSHASSVGGHPPSKARSVPGTGYLLIRMPRSRVNREQVDAGSGAQVAEPRSTDPARVGRLLPVLGNSQMDSGLSLTTPVDQGWTRG
jgi:hypothetical protein